MDKLKKEYIELLRSMSGAMSVREVFAKTIEAFFYMTQYEKNPANMCMVVDTLKAFDKEKCLRLYQIIIEAFELEYRDFLGEIYMQLGSNKYLAQDFTPISITRLMAELTFNEDNVKETIKQKGFCQILDPAVGGGSTIISNIAKMKNCGIDVSHEVFVVGQDKDLLCCQMAYIQLFMCRASGIICCADSLSNPLVFPSEESILPCVKKGQTIWLLPNTYDEVWETRFSLDFFRMRMSRV